NLRNIIGAYINEGETIFWLVSAIIIAPCAIFGDLLESLFKRSLNIKDSGNILPGHGGILDRFDAALFAIPFFYCWSMIYLFW
ncbi:MAG: phosphatidate cytidylyltransferase, partial [Crocinitomicaceae bacterium]